MKIQNLKANKRIILLAALVVSSFVANAQSEQWKAYLDIRKQSRADMSPCEKMELYARMDSIFDGYIPVRRMEMNYMEAALQCGDTATFKRLAFRVVRWKGWNPLVFYYTDQYRFLKDCDWWLELDSIQQAVHSRKDYSYAETLHQMQQEDQAARRAFRNPSLTPADEDSLGRRMRDVDSANLVKLKWLIDTLGFPTWDRVCSYGSADAWLVAQHLHPWFQYGYVKQLRQAVADTNADPSNLAYLEDRLRTGRGLPQLYGTQFTSTSENNRTVWQCPVADIKNVNFRREQMLMPPLEDYIEGYLKSSTEDGQLDSDTPLTEMGDDYMRYYYLGDQFSLQPIDKQEGVTDAVAYTIAGDYCAAIPIFCSRLSNLYPFVRDLKHYLECLLHSECVDQYCYISHFEVLERMVLCGYEPDAWLDSLPDTLTAPLLADYANLRDEYLRYLNHEDDAVLSAALASRSDFESLLRSGKNYHRYELDAWNHAYPLLQKMTDELTKGDYKEFYALLWREVERGNLHAEDYASLYDRTYYRLHGKDWYGTLAASDKHIRTAKPKALNERRRTACPTVASAQDTLTPSQMWEDFSYMMEQYERVHPNPTWSLGGERYNELKQQTLARLDRPMTQLDFWRIIAWWNQYFDGHTHVGFPPSAPRMPEGMMVFPPYSIVQYRNGKLRFSSYDGMPDSLRGCEITSIDGHPASEVVDSILPYISHESEAYLNTIVLRSLNVYYNLFFGYSPQMTFAYRTAGGERSVVLDRRILYEWLVQVGDKGNIGGTGPHDIPWHFSIFPEQSIALFEFNSCGPNDKFPQFDSVVAACIDSVNHYGINHLFVDISHNSGGNDAFCKRFLCHLDGLPDTVAAMDMMDTEMGTVANPEEKRVKMFFYPKNPSYGGKLYFIQSQFTYSAAILLANMAKQYRLGPVIGEETGGLTTTFTRHNPISLPNSGLTFYCSDKQFRHIGTTGPHGVLPDIPLEIGYKYLFRSFTVEELQQMIETAQSEQWKAYLDICGQFRADMTPCEKMELYARMDSLFGGHMPEYNNLYNYMISSFLCGDTMTFKKQLVRATDWKCWNSKLIETWDAVDFLKKEKDWNQLDSLSKIYGIKKIYPYMDSLEAMVERDQAIRSELHNPSLSIEQRDSIFTQWQIIDSTNLTLLKSLIKRYGFPTWERVGYTGCRNAWLIAQHAIPYIYDFEKEYRKAVMDNNATKNLLAYLEDRSRTMRGLPQLYGTQLATNPKDYLPISDIKNVNSRREEIGLEPLNDYLKRMSIDINDYFILQDTSEPNYIDFYYKGNKLEPWGVIKAQGYFDENEFDKASVLYCHVFHNTYPFIRDLKRFVSTLIMNGGKSDQYLFISTYEVLERMVLCGYEPDAWLDSLPDTLTAPLLADYANLRDEYLRYLNHEDDAVLSAALASRADFEALLRSGKNQRSATDSGANSQLATDSGANYHRYELDAWNHAYPSLQKMTDELTKGDYEEFFALLWREVERGNLHAEDYASLYDHTYYRLYGKDWYGTEGRRPSVEPTLTASDKHIRTAKPKRLNERRCAACLPPTR